MWIRFLKQFYFQHSYLMWTCKERINAKNVNIIVQADLLSTFTINQSPLLFQLIVNFNNTFAYKSIVTFSPYY